MRICYLYPEMMNIYGDRGNIMTLAKRCRWRGIGVDVEELSLDDRIRPGRYDIFFMGGGQDREQVLVHRDLLENKGSDIKREIEEGAAALVVCGGYQLFGRSYRPAGAEELPGINVFDAYTVAGGNRMIGNVVAKSALGGRFGTVVGFENHSGRTFLGKESVPLGMVTVGSGNNGEDRTEGAVHLGAVGTYLHGPILPKNPGLADFLIERGLKHRGDPTPLKPLDDTLEWRGHQMAVARARKTH